MLIRSTLYTTVLLMHAQRFLGVISHAEGLGTANVLTSTCTSIEWTAVQYTSSLWKKCILLGSVQTA